MLADLPGLVYRTLHGLEKKQFIGIYAGQFVGGPGNEIGERGFPGSNLSEILP